MPIVDQLITLLLEPAITPLLLIAGVLLLERYWQIPEQANPFSLFRYIAKRMADKVRPRQSDNQLQQIISGSMAMGLLSLPVLIILYFMREFAYYPLFFDALLMFLCVQFSGNTKRFRAVMWVLKRNKNSLAKDRLAPMLLRDTSRLSEIGICKAATESLVLRFYYQQLVCIFWYILLGPFVALFYRLLFEILQVWNPKSLAYRQFGRPVARLCYWIQWLPVRLAGLLAILCMRGVFAFRLLVSGSAMRALLGALIASNGALILQVNSAALNLHLSGAVMYAQQKVRRVKYLGKREPQLVDMHLPSMLIDRTLMTFWVFMLLLSVLLHKTATQWGL